jgi:endonuclease-3
MDELTSNETIDRMMEILTVEYEKWHAPIVTFVANTRQEPFPVLVSTILSLRTKDETTAKASEKLFARATTPQEMLRLQRPSSRS